MSSSALIVRTVINSFQQILEQQSSQFSSDNFSFSARAIIGYFLQPAPPPYATDGEYIRMTDVDVAKRLEELKMFTKQSLNVEQRIEIARQQQAIRDAKKMAKDEIVRNKDKVCSPNRTSFLNTCEFTVGSRRFLIRKVVSHASRRKPKG